MSFETYINNINISLEYFGENRLVKWNLSIPVYTWQKAVLSMLQSLETHYNSITAQSYQSCGQQSSPVTK